MERVRCSHCGEEHDISEMEIGFDKPDAYFEVPTEERDQRVSINEDLCVIDEWEFFIRGFLEIPVRDRQESFAWGIWVRIDKEPFERYVNLFRDDAQAEEPPFEGRIANHIPTYPQTLDLPVEVKLTSATERPQFTLKDRAHQLFMEQRDGVDTARLLEILSPLLH